MKNILQEYTENENHDILGVGGKSAFNKSGIKRSKAWKYMRCNTRKIKKRFQCKNKYNINPNCNNS